MKDEMARTFSISDKFMSSTLQNYKEVQLSGAKWANIPRYIIDVFFLAKLLQHLAQTIIILDWVLLFIPPLTPPLSHLNNVQLLMLRIESVGRKHKYLL